MNTPPRLNGERVPVVLLGLGIPGLDIARSLGRRSIRVFGIDWRRNWASRSRYIAATLCPEQQTEEHLLQLLERLAARLGCRPLLIPLHDDHVLFVSRRREQLARHYRFRMADAAVIEALVSKRGQSQLCQGNGVDLPATYYAASSAELADLAPHIVYPCVVKPNFSRDWVRSRPPTIDEGQKVITIASPAELSRVGALLDAGYGDVVVQEVIPGPDVNLHYLVAYLDQNGEPLATFVGRKLRTCPPHFGNGTYVESVRAPQIVRLGLELLKKLGYTGSVGIEFKLDPRDGSFKLIEINARFGLWDGFAAKCGLDFAYIAYADAVGLPALACNGYRAGVRWAQPDRDFWTVLEYRRAGEIGLARWLASLARCRALAPGAWDDPVPWVGLNILFAHRLLLAAGRRILS